MKVRKMKRHSDDPRQKSGADSAVSADGFKPAVALLPAVAHRAAAHIPGKPPLPFIASIWRIIFFAPPPLNIFIICCIC